MVIVFSFTTHDILSTVWKRKCPVLVFVTLLFVPLCLYVTLFFLFLTEILSRKEIFFSFFCIILWNYALSLGARRPVYIMPSSLSSAFFVCYKWPYLSSLYDNFVRHELILSLSLAIEIRNRRWFWVYKKPVCLLKSPSFLFVLSLNMPNLASRT